MARLSACRSGLPLLLAHEGNVEGCMEDAVQLVGGEREPRLPCRFGPATKGTQKLPPRLPISPSAAFIGVGR